MPKATLHEYVHNETEHSLTRVFVNDVPLDELDETLALAHAAGQLVIATSPSIPLGFTSVIGVTRLAPTTNDDIVPHGGFFGTDIRTPRR